MRARQPGAGVIVGHPDTGFTPHPDLADSARLLVNLGRDFDDDDERRLRESGIKPLRPPELASGAALAAALDALEPEPTGLYLHVDLDVLDAEAAQVNIYSVPDGISADQLASRVEHVLDTGAVKAMSLTAYDP